MPLLHVMHDTPLWLTALVVLAIVAVYSIGLMLLTRRIYGLSWLTLNNEVAGFKFAVVGVFYAVLLAFVVIAVWEEYRNTETAVRDEAKAAINLHRVSSALPTEHHAEIHKQLQAYVEDVSKYEWPEMALGGSSAVVANHLHQLGQAVFAIEPRDAKEVILYQDALRLMAVISNNRNERLDSATGTVPGLLWAVLIVGGIITLGYPAFFGSTNVGAQILMTASLALLVALSLLLGLAFDYPFTGVVSITPFPFEEALRQMSAGWPPAPPT